jgi:hypothetical protein
MRSLLILLALSLPAFGQNKTTPDCDIQFTFTATGQRSAVTGCAQNVQGVWEWRVTYQVNGYSAVSVALQSAPDSNGVPGSWSNWAGTITSGFSNPSTTTPEGSISATGFYPWASVTLGSATGSGSVTGHLYGCREPGCSIAGPGGGGGGGGTTCTSLAPCPVDGVTAAGSPPTTPPVLTAGQDGTNVQTLKTDTAGDLFVAGTVPPGSAAAKNPVPIGTKDTAGNVERALSDVNGSLLSGAYPNTAAITLTTSGLAVLVAHSGSLTTTVSHYSISFASAVTFQLEYGTGSACGTGTTALTGVYQPLTGIAIDTPFIVPAGKDLCANLGSSVNGGGVVVYSQP